MKKILFMNNTLGVGGISSSLVNTANELSKNYDVSIFCYIPEGPSKERLSEKVHVLDSSWRFIAMCSSLSSAGKLGLKYFLYKVFARLWSVVFDNRLPIAIAMKHQKHLGYYDLACCYTHEGHRHIEYTGLIRVLIEKVDSKKKLSWIHCDYNFVKDRSFNVRYFNKIDGVVGVTDSVAAAFRDTNPDVRVNIGTCYNMLDYDRLMEKASEETTVTFKDTGLLCFSACRLAEVKALPRAIHACADIFNKNDVYWYIAGDGPEKEKIQAAINEEGLNDRVILIGEQVNPFKYMKKADLYLSVSYEEAAPLVYLEAKALHVPVFSTKTLSTEEMLDPEIDFICENNEVSLHDGFMKASSNHEEIRKRKEKLASYVGTNDKAVRTYKEWLGDL